MKKMNIFTLALIVMSFSLASCGGSGASKGDKPGDVVKSFYKLMQKKDFENAAKLFASGDQLATQEETTKIEGMIGMGYAEYEKVDGVKEVSITEEEIAEDGLTAKVRYTIVFGDGSEDNTKMTLHKIEGKWYLDVVSQ